MAFDVNVNDEAYQAAKAEGIKIFTGKIIYNVFDEFMEYKK